MYCDGKHYRNTTQTSNAMRYKHVLYRKLMRRADGNMIMIHAQILPISQMDTHVSRPALGRHVLGRGEARVTWSGRVHLRRLPMGEVYTEKWNIDEQGRWVMSYQPWRSPGHRWTKGQVKVRLLKVTYTWALLPRWHTHTWCPRLRAVSTLSALSSPSSLCDKRASPH